MLIGHRKIVDFFERAIKDGSLAHTYCFVGPDQVGKRTLATRLAAQILKVEEEKVSAHPDWHYVARLEDEKTGKLKRDLSIAQAREIRGRLQRKSWLNGYQVMVIDEAETLSEEAANALLKILEEPPEKSVIFLLAENELALPATIRSRCQIFFLAPVSKQEIIQGLEQSGVMFAAASEAAELAWGRPGRAVELAASPEMRENYLSEVERFKKMIGQPFYSKLKIIEDIFGPSSSRVTRDSGRASSDDTVRKREHIQDVLDIWIMQFRIMITEKVDSRFSAQRVREIIDSLGEAKKFLRQNIHPRLLIEQVILNF